ncbi:CheY-like receiver protein [Candidatus Terasakiella magnetica]|nr:CheY-like receiver protein [Candidatus Terasakiella magnetica]
MTVKTVLLVDDSRVARMMARASIVKAFPSWLVMEAASGEEALTLATSCQPDFVLMDVNMPGMGGVATARQLRQTFPSAVITLLTANIQDSIRQEAEEIGIGFLTKPFREELLLQFLRSGSGVS